MKLICWATRKNYHFLTGGLLARRGLASLRFLAKTQRISLPSGALMIFYVRTYLLHFWTVLLVMHCETMNFALSFARFFVLSKRRHVPMVDRQWKVSWTVGGHERGGPEGDFVSDDLWTVGTRLRGDRPIGRRRQTCFRRHGWS